MATFVDVRDETRSPYDDDVTIRINCKVGKSKPGPPNLESRTRNRKLKISWTGLNFSLDGKAISSPGKKLWRSKCPVL